MADEERRPVDRTPPHTDLNCKPDHNGDGELSAEDAAKLSRTGTDRYRLQLALLTRLRAHERDGTLPTNAQFLWYELEPTGLVSKRPRRQDGKPSVRRRDQNLTEALTHLREAGLVPWDWITDETRELHRFATAPTVLEYVAGSVDYAALDRWGGEPAPLILCESRSLAGVLYDLAATYACPLASTNGHSRAFLISEVAPRLKACQRVLYLGDGDHCGHQIEAANRRTLIEHAPLWGLWPRWERVALTARQVREHRLEAEVISKPDKRYRPVRYFDAIETEALGQARIVAALTARLDELMPEPLDAVLERQTRQRERVAEQLRQLREEEP